MPETQQSGSIFRDLLLPRDPNSDQDIKKLGTFRLRYAFAEDGCRNSQVILAKILLDNISNTSEEKSFNAQLAVYWLLQAAKKGHNEAFDLLKDCLHFDIETRLISKADIEYCLNFSQEERIARAVTYSLFREIMSDTEDVITETVLRENVDLVFKQNKRKLSPTPQDTESSLWNRPPSKKNDSPPLTKTNESQGPLKKSPVPLSLSPKKSDESDNSDKTSSTSFLLKNPVIDSMTKEEILQTQDRVSFNQVMSSVQSCLEGNPPLISLTQVTQCGVYSWRCFSTKYISLFWNIVLRSAEKLIAKVSSLVLLMSVFLLCALLQFVNYSFTFGNETSIFISKVSLLMVTFLSFLAMVSYTCFVLHINFGGDNFIKWLSLIKIFEPNVRSDDVEKKYVTKTTLPLTIFFFVSFIYSALIPLSLNPLPFADIGVLSFVLMVLVDRTIYKERYYVNISLALNALTCIYKTNIFRNMYSSLSYFNITIDYEVAQNLYMHLSFLSCLALPFVLPYIYVKMSRGQKRGWHLVLFPHLMSLTWMNLACIHLVDITVSQCLFSAVTWLFIILASRCISTPLTLGVYTILNISDAFQMQVLLLGIVFIILYFACLFFCKKFKCSPHSKLWSVCFCIGMLFLSYQVFKSGDSSQDVFKHVTPWDKYQSLCHQNSWFHSNTAERQISCLLLKGKKISMEGTVTTIEVVGVRNNMEFVANMLPQPLQNWFVCGFGKNFASCNSDGMTDFEKERCELYRNLNLNQCYLQNWDEYKYKLVLELNMRYYLDVEIYADHGSSGFVRNLKEGDSVQVIGALESNIGKNLPGFILKHAKCTSCPGTDFSHTSSLPVLDYALSLKNIVQLYLAPLLVYEQK